QVRAGARFGHRDGSHHVATDEIGQPTLLLLFGSVGQDVWQDQASVYTECAKADCRTSRLFGQGSLELEACFTRSAVLHGNRHSENTEFAELAIEVAGHHALALPIGEVGHDLGFDEAAD